MMLSCRAVSGCGREYSHPWKTNKDWAGLSKNLAISGMTRSKYIRVCFVDLCNSTRCSVWISWFVLGMVILKCIPYVRSPIVCNVWQKHTRIVHKAWLNICAFSNCSGQIQYHKVLCNPQSLLHFITWSGFPWRELGTWWPFIKPW